MNEINNDNQNSEPPNEPIKRNDSTFKSQIVNRNYKIHFK